MLEKRTNTTYVDCKDPQRKNSIFPLGDPKIFPLGDPNTEEQYVPDEFTNLKSQIEENQISLRLCGLFSTTHIKAEMLEITFHHCLEETNVTPLYFILGY